MNDRKHWMAAVSHFIHHYFLWLLVGSYVVAAVLPGWGTDIKSVSFGNVTMFQETTKVSLPLLMLSFLLFNAGLGVKMSRLRGLLRNPLPLAGGLLANLVVPIAFIYLVHLTMKLWHNDAEVQNILVGLALVASMPIAGSSTAWSQNANGDMALSLGLVLLSTFLSPLTTPIALHAVGLMTTGDYSEDLHELAEGGTTGFLAIGVILPSLLGILCHAIFGEERIAKVKPGLKIANFCVLLLLNYANGSAALPQAVKDPDWDFLGVILAIVVSLCVLAFVAGWWLAKILRSDGPGRISLMFGLGMNNNGTGLVLATMKLDDHPLVMLPIIFYNLVQHLVAGGVDKLLSQPESAVSEPRP